MLKLRKVLLVAGIAALGTAVANEYYDHASGVPSTGSLGSSATMRAEFDAIAAGFDRLPVLAGNGNEAVFVNTGGTALESVDAATARTRIGAVAMSGGSLTGGTLSGTTTNSGTISGGTISGATISGATLSGTTTNSGTISGGTLSGTITNSGTISGGTLSGATISGGTLSGTITNSGTISGGTISGATLSGATASGGNIVTTDTAQTITGLKTFTSPIVYGDESISEFVNTNDGIRLGNGDNIEFLTSVSGNNYGFKIYGNDPGGGTELRIAARSNSATWGIDPLININDSGGIEIGSPTGGDKGAGTLNVAGGIYQNNVPVVTETGTQTLTNKTYSGGTIAGTIAGSPTLSGVWTFSGSVQVAGSLSSTKTCASGYARITPNYCVRTGSFSTTPLTRDVCAVIARPSIDATALVMYVRVHANAANAQGVRYAEVTATAHDIAQCASAEITAIWATSAIEEVARVAGTEESRDSGTQVVPVSAAGNVYLQLDDDTGNQGVAAYRIMGYYD